MKREVERERKLPAFSLVLGDLEALWSRLLALFDDPDDVYAVIDIRRPSEQLEFKSIEELKNYSELRGVVTSFSIRLSQNGRRLVIRTPYFFGSRAIVTATAESEAWCAGAIETVVSFLGSYKTRYNWFLSAPIGWILIVLANIPALTSAISKETQFTRPVVVGWLALTATFGLLFFYKEKLLPGAALTFSSADNFLRRYAAELSLLIAVISAALTVIGWFISAK